MTIVAISASYGAAGGRIASALAERLHVAFLDRAIPLAVAARLAVPYDAVAAYDEQVSANLMERVLRGFLGADIGPAAALPTDALTAADFRRATEQVLMQQAATGEGVILGRGAVPVLRHHPGALRVRLDGPPERRIRQAMRLEGIDQSTAARSMRRLDSTHRAYFKHFYAAQPNDPSLYHLMIDSTMLSIEACVELIASAAQSLSGLDRPRPHPMVRRAGRRRRARTEHPRPGHSP